MGSSSWFRPAKETSGCSICCGELRWPTLVCPVCSRTKRTCERWSRRCGAKRVGSPSQRLVQRERADLPISLLQEQNHCLIRKEVAKPKRDGKTEMREI